MARVLTLICEGETAARRRGLFPGEDALTPLSLRQAEALRGAFPLGDEVWSAPQTASRQTAVALALRFAVEPSLADLDYGRWTGRRIQDVMSEEPEGFRAWMGGAAPPEGEALADLFARVDRWLTARAHVKGRVAVVASANVVRAAILARLGAGPEAASRLDVMPLSVSEFTSDGRTWRLRSLNSGSRTRSG